MRAGAELFDRRGYANATVGDIAGAAGTTKGALYFHFSSKDELADAVLRRARDLLRDQVRELGHHGGPALQTVIDLTFWLARTLRDDPTVRAGFRITGERTGELFLALNLHAAWMAAVQQLLRQARAAGELRQRARWEGPETLVAAVVGGIETMSRTGMPHDELCRRVGALWELMLPALAAPGGERRLRTTPPPGPLGAGPANDATGRHEPGARNRCTGAESRNDPMEVSHT